MRKILPLLMLLILLFVPNTYAQRCEADGTELARLMPHVGGGVPAAAAGFSCVGGELFCADFETDAMITWTGTANGEDCDGTLQSNDTWCDYDATNKLAGAHGFTIRGDYRNTKTITASAEFYVEYLWQVTEATSAIGLRYWSEASTVPIQINVDSSDHLVIKINEGADIGMSVAYTISNNTMYHIGFYYKKEVASGNDGIIRIWVNTSTATFTASDLKLNLTGQNTEEQDPSRIRLQGPAVDQIAIYDNVKATSGACPWPTS